MKVKEIYVEAALSKNFQKYTVGFLIEIDHENIDLEEFTRKIQTRARKLAQEQIAIDKGV